MKKLEIAKTVLKTVATIGTSSIVATITGNAIPRTNIVTQVCGIVGSTAIGMMVADAVGDYVDKKFDETVDAIYKLKEE